VMGEEDGARFGARGAGLDDAALVIDREAVRPRRGASAHGTTSLVDQVW